MSNITYTEQELKLMEEMADANKAQFALNNLATSIFNAVRVKQAVISGTEEIWAEKKFTDAYRAQQVQQLKDKAVSELNKLRDNIAENVQKLAARVEAVRPKLNLSDSNFQTALSLISMAENELDASTQKEIAGMFNGNAALLKALLPVLVKHKLKIAEMAVQAELARIARAEDFPQKAVDFGIEFTASTDNHGGASEIYSEMRTFASVYGMNAPAMPNDVMLYMMRSAAGVF